MREQHGAAAAPPVSGEIVLWKRAQEGDPDAFGQIFDRHRGRVYRRALRVVPSSRDAEAVMALVFLEAWRKRSSVRVADGSVLAWLLLTTTSVASNAARAKRRHRIALAKIPPQERVACPSDEVLERLAAARIDAVHTVLIDNVVESRLSRQNRNGFFVACSMAAASILAVAGIGFVLTSSGALRDRVTDSVAVAPTESPGPGITPGTLAPAAPSSPTSIPTLRP